MFEKITELPFPRLPSFAGSYYLYRAELTLFMAMQEAAWAALKKMEEEEERSVKATQNSIKKTLCQS